MKKQNDCLLKSVIDSINEYYIQKLKVKHNSSLTEEEEIISNQN